MANPKENHSVYSFPQRALIVVGIVVTTLLLIFLFGYLFKVLLFVLAAILAASFFRGIARWLSNRSKIPMLAGIIISILVVLGIIFLLNWLLIPSVVRQANQLVQQLPSSVQSAREYLQGQWWGRSLAHEIPNSPQQFFASHSGWASRTFGLLSSTFGFLSDIYIILLIGLFIMFRPKPYVNGLVSLVPQSYQSRAREVIHRVCTILQRWLLGKLSSMLIVAILTAIGLYIIGLPLVLFLSILAGLLAFIPNFGPIIAIIPTLLVASLNGPRMMLYVVIVYITVQVLESNIITPFIQRKMVYMPLAMVIIAQVVLGILVGGLGLIFATPIVAVLMVLVRMLYIEDILGQQLASESSK